MQCSAVSEVGMWVLLYKSSRDVHVWKYVINYVNIEGTDLIFIL